MINLEDIKFNSLKELYERLLPALRSKIKELKVNGYNYIKEEDIWNYFKKVKWTNCKTLTLYDMVDDVLNIPNNKIDEYVKNEFAKTERIKDVKEE